MRKDKLFTMLCVIVQVCLLQVISGYAEQRRPKMIDFGAKECVPCKLMAPILEELKKEYAGKIDVEFVDVWQKENAKRGLQAGIKVIPTQIFYNSADKEIWRHEGFISKEGILLKWRELGVELPFGPTFKRLEPAIKDERPKDKICFMCDGDVDTKSMVTVTTEKGNVNLCSAHHFFVMLSCLLKDVDLTEKSAMIADAMTGKMVPVMSAFYLYQLNEKTGRPVIKAFAERSDAEKVRQLEGGSIINYNILKPKELSYRCGFCDRAVYSEDSALVKIDGIYSWGCCAHCAMGCAARSGKDIEVHQPDRLSGEMIVVKTLNGYVVSIEPKTAVAWFGKRKNTEGKFVSAGCFHQGFFVNEDSLMKWVEEHPFETGEAITIEQSLQDKMALSPVQIQKACKIGECTPK